MACVNPDGSLTSSGRQMLRLLEKPLTDEELGHASGQPLFKIRSSLREMMEAELVVASEGRYQTTDQGRVQASKGQ